MLVFVETGKPENLEKKLSEQSREPANSAINSMGDKLRSRDAGFFKRGRHFETVGKVAMATL